MDYYSARLLFVILVDDGRPRRRNHYNECVVVFRARGLQHAKRRALQLGREMETQYPNHKGQKVRWAFVEVVTLDRVGRGVNGKEVASRFFFRVSAKPIPVRHRFRPEASEPSESGIDTGAT
jgi:uncharacterized protein DUF4288